LILRNISMAKRRLNKNVALIGSAVFVFMILAVIGGILILSQDPAKFIEDGDAAMAAGDYETAERCYHKARSLADSDRLKVEMLTKLTDLYRRTGKWQNVLGCCNNIVRLEPGNVRARFLRLDYLHAMAGTGIGGLWRDIESQATEFIDLAEQEGLLSEKTSQWGIFGPDDRRTRYLPRAETLGSHLYLLRGMARYEIASAGGVTDQDKVLADAVGDLEKSLQLESNVHAYWYLAEVVVAEGNLAASRGDIEQKDKASARALELLEEAVESSGDNPASHINLLKMKLRTISRDRIDTLEDEYLAVVEKFPSNGRVYSALASYYSDYRFGPKNIEKAVEAAARAVELDPENVNYARDAAGLYYRRFSVEGHVPSLHKALETAEKALTLPDLQETEGPMMLAARNHRAWLNIFLANCCLEQVIDPDEEITGIEPQQWLEKGRNAVHQIEQLIRSPEDPQLTKWRGMLDLAQGNEREAVSKLYEAYELIAAADRDGVCRDPQLCYTLFRVFRRSREIGAVAEFLKNAIIGGVAQTKPEAVLDYIAVLMDLGDYEGALGAINSFENLFWSDEHSRRLRVRALIGAGQFDGAEEQLDEADAKDAETARLRLAITQARIERVRRAIAQKRQQRSLGPVLGQTDEQPTADDAMSVEIEAYQAKQAELVEKILSLDPNYIGESQLTRICEYYIDKGVPSAAGALVARFLQAHENNTTARFYNGILAEPDPGAVPAERRLEIERQVLTEISDPVRRSLNLGLFYHRQQDAENAASEFEAVLANLETEQGDLDGVRKQQYAIAARYLQDIALQQEDWERVDRVLEVASRYDLDDCGGRLLAAHSALARQRYDEAVEHADACITLHPVLSEAYMLRGRARNMLGDERDAIEDIRRASALNPLDGSIAKILASSLVQRNERLGGNVTADQMVETRSALDRAISLNPNDVDLLDFYTGFITDSEPMKALAVRQTLQEASPGPRNASLLAGLATSLAAKERDAARREALFEIAENTLAEASRSDPNDRMILEAYARYYRVSGQGEKAEQVLADSGDLQLLWLHYYNSGRYDEAAGALEKLYQQDPESVETIKGLLIVADAAADEEAAKRYSKELIALEESVDNRLLLVQTFLKMGLVKEAGLELEALKERYPDEHRTLLLEAWLAMRQGRLAEALDLTNRNLQADDENPTAWRLRGQINHFIGKYEQAVSDLGRSLALTDDASTRVALARSYVALGRYEDAITELKITAERPQARAEANELLERIYLRRGPASELRDFYREILEESPTVFWFLRAASYASSQGDFEQAARLYRRVLETDRPDDGQTAEALSGLLGSLVSQAGAREGDQFAPDKLESVREEAAKYFETDLAPVAYIAMAEVRKLLGDKSGALEFSRKALARADTDESLASNILRRMYIILGAEEVERYCSERLAENPDSFAANWTMFNVSRIGGRYNKALEHIDKCIEITPEEGRRADYVIQKAMTLSELYEKTSDKNYLHRAVAEYESLLEKMPNNSGVLNNVAYLMAKADLRLDDAIQYAEGALKEQPNNAGYLDTYAFCLYKAGRYEQAAERMQSALQQYELAGATVPAAVLSHSGMINEMLDDKEAALAAYRRALEIADNISDSERAAIEDAVERLSVK